MSQEEILPFLLTQGFSPQYEGFRNLNQTLQYTLENPEQIHSVMAIYAAVAKVAGTTPECVEHNIRYLIESWHIASGNPNRPKPQNKTVISLLTLHLMMGHKDKISF